jgi:dipeptidyl aminopeptidase/acylaminoacyl peptidase
VLGHELVHAFQYDILGANIGRAPLWFIEGMAEYLSIGPRSPQTAMWLRDAALEGRLPRIRDLYDPRYFPYRFGHALWAYIGGRFGDAAVGATLRRLAPEVGGLDEIQALEVTSSLDDEELSAGWHAAIHALYGITPRDRDQARTALAELPKAILAERQGDGSVNIGPSLSPDGSRIAFLSERSRLSIEVYVADSTTGEDLRRLTSTAVDSHFESLQFLSSSGSWAPDNRRLALASVQKGRGAIVIFDTSNGDVLNTVPFEERGEVFQPSWSPDGSSIAFVGQVGGFTDLFLHSLADGTTRRLTTDAFADLQPAWSPDGRELLFITDRYTSRLDTLAFGPMSVAVMNVASGEMTSIPTGAVGLTSSPQWSSDGASIVFLSDRSGRPDVYRVPRAGGEPVALTAIPTGVSGITPLSPALSVARTGNKTAYSVFRDGGYEIRLLEETPGTSADPKRPDLALLPPADRVTSVVAQQLDRPAAGLPAATTFETTPYRPGLSLVGVGQSLGASTGGEFGTYVSGGISMLFSDVLGNHLVPVSVGVEGGVKDFAGQASYVNRTSRWNWGVFGSHIPLRSGYVEAGLDVVDGVPVYVERTELLRETSTQLGALVAYPFSRSTRLEVSGSVRRIGFGRERQTLGFDPVTGEFLFEDTEDLAGFPALRLAATALALVGDRTAFGPVGPVAGQRYRFEVAPTFGDLRMTMASVDFRRYAMPVRPLTLAFRALHVGRYGAGGEDSRLVPLFLGYSTLVRGYDPGSFESSECTIAADGSCPEFDRLSGSRLLVVGGEARMPIGGFFTGNLDYGPIPTEVFGFYDAGVAWNRANKPQFLDGTRQWVTSVGVGARVNVFGYAVAEFNLARALDRVGRGWQFVFNLGSSY